MAVQELHGGQPEQYILRNVLESDSNRVVDVNEQIPIGDAVLTLLLLFHQSDRQASSCVDVDSTAADDQDGDGFMLLAP